MGMGITQVSSLGSNPQRYHVIGKAAGDTGTSQKEHTLPQRQLALV